MCVCMCACAGVGACERRIVCVCEREKERSPTKTWERARGEREKYHTERERKRRGWSEGRFHCMGFPSGFIDGSFGVSRNAKLPCETHPVAILPHKSHRRGMTNI